MKNKINIKKPKIDIIAYHKKAMQEVIKLNQEAKKDSQSKGFWIVGPTNCG